MKKQQGMTLIEMMIVIAVIGVIASIAIPIYNDYIKRSKVAEAVQLLGALKVPTLDYYATWSVWPSVAQIGGQSQGRYVDNIVSVDDGTLLYVEATMRGPDTDLDGKKLRMVHNVSTNSWICTTNGVSPPIDDRFLPSACRNP